MLPKLGLESPESFVEALPTQPGIQCKLTRSASLRDNAERMRDDRRTIISLLEYGVEVRGNVSFGLQMFKRIPFAEFGF